MLAHWKLIGRFTNPVHVRLRQARCSLAVNIMTPDNSMSLLDVGGSVGFGGEFGYLRAKFGKVTVANPDPAIRTKGIARGIHLVRADGCALPYADKSFDWVFSNAVIEHVGARKRQDQFASEIRRVARRGYFVSTPNRLFPIDPHTYLPWFHFMPIWLQRCAVKFSLGGMRRWQPLNLVSAGQLRELFPGAHVQAVGPLGLNLVAFTKDEHLNQPNTGGTMLKNIVHQLTVAHRESVKETIAIAEALTALKKPVKSVKSERRSLSLEARGRIATAQRLRWKKIRMANGKKGSRRAA